MDENRFIKYPQFLPSKEAIDNYICVHGAVLLIYPDSRQWFLDKEHGHIGYSWTEDPYWGGKTMEVVETSWDEKIAWCEEKNA